MAQACGIARSDFRRDPCGRTQPAVAKLCKYDALHVVCAIQSATDLFVSTDGRLIRKLRGHNGILALLPGDVLAHLENWYEN